VRAGYDGLVPVKFTMPRKSLFYSDAKIWRESLALFGDISDKC